MLRNMFFSHIALLVEMPHLYLLKILHNISYSSFPFSKAHTCSLPFWAHQSTMILESPKISKSLMFQDLAKERISHILEFITLIYVLAPHLLIMSYDAPSKNPTMFKELEAGGWICLTLSPPFLGWKYLKLLMDLFDTVHIEYMAFSNTLCSYFSRYPMKCNMEIPCSTWLLYSVFQKKK